MNRIAALLAVATLATCLSPVFAAVGQTVSHPSVKPKSAHGHKAPMRHDQLTLSPHGRPARRQPAYGSTRHRFDHPTPIHNTFMGVQRW